MFKETGCKLAESVAAVAENNKPDLVESMICASDRVDDLEVKLQDAVKAGESAGKIARVEANLKAALAAWEAAKGRVEEDYQGRGVNEAGSSGNIEGGESDD